MPVLQSSFQITEIKKVAYYEACLSLTPKKMKKNIVPFGVLNYLMSYQAVVNLRCYRTSLPTRVNSGQNDDGRRLGER